MNVLLNTICWLCGLLTGGMIVMIAHIWFLNGLPSIKKNKKVKDWNDGKIDITRIPEDQADPDIANFRFNFMFKAFSREMGEHCSLLMKIRPLGFYIFSWYIWAMRTQFTAGFCYVFAKILEMYYPKGEVCWMCPKRHFVYVRDDGIAYDILSAIKKTDKVEFIPERYIERKGVLRLYMHNIYDKDEWQEFKDMEIEEFQKAYKKYIKYNNLEFNQEIYDNICIDEED